MRNKYIKLTEIDGEIIYINALMICAIKKFSKTSYVSTLSGEGYSVKETSEEIIKLIDESEKYVFKNVELPKI